MKNFIYDNNNIGLTEDEIRQRVFEAIHDTGYMIFCTIGLDGVTPTNRGLEVHYLDVGQADCILLQCDGTNMLIDGGNVEEEDEQGTTTPDPSPSNPDTGEEDDDGGLAG